MRKRRRGTASHNPDAIAGASVDTGEAALDVGGTSGNYKNIRHMEVWRRIKAAHRAAKTRYIAKRLGSLEISRFCRSCDTKGWSLSVVD